MDSNMFEFYAQSNEKDEDKNLTQYSLNNLIKMDNDFLNDKTFQTLRRENFYEVNTQ